MHYSGILYDHVDDLESEVSELTTSLREWFVLEYVELMIVEKQDFGEFNRGGEFGDLGFSFKNRKPLDVDIWKVVILIPSGRRAILNFIL